MEAYQQLECDISEWVERTPRQVVACSSGTAALHLAFEALRLVSGPAFHTNQSGVVMSEFNMIACPRSVALAGLTTTLIDCDRRLLPDSHHLSWFLNNHVHSSPPIRAVLVTHIYGRVYDVAPFHDAVYVLGVPVAVVEDMAEAHGCQIHPDSFAAAYSFYRNKVVHGEEGGCVVFKDADVADVARSLRSLGFNDDHDYWHLPRGHNYRLSNCHAELIRNSLLEVDDNLDRRRELVSRYEEVTPGEWRMPVREYPWVYDIRIPGLTEERQKMVVGALNQSGVRARMAFKPVGMQPEFSDCFSTGRTEALLASREVIYLPLDPGVVTTPMIEKSLQVIHKEMGT